MGDKPIIFSAPMIRALMAGRKTQTRRVLKPQPFVSGYHNGGVSLDKVSLDYARFSAMAVGASAIIEHVISLPYATGDRLYVREAFSYETLDVDRNGFMPPWYWSDGNPRSGDYTRPKPSIHMPRWASRLTLTVTDVRVQRLQEISGQDSIAEGVECDTCTAMKVSACHGKGCFASKDAYRTLWNSLHGPDAWDANPWVVAVSFSVQHGNIDQIGGTHD